MLDCFISSCGNVVSFLIFSTLWLSSFILTSLLQSWIGETFWFRHLRILDILLNLPGRGWWDDFIAPWMCQPLSSKVFCRLIKSRLNLWEHTIFTSCALSCNNLKKINLEKNGGLCRDQTARERAHHCLILWSRRSTVSWLNPSSQCSHQIQSSIALNICLTIPLTISV